MTDVVASSAALAAAVAAAAEIAKHGGAEAFLFAAAIPESDVLETNTTAVVAAAVVADSRMIAEQLYATKTTPEEQTKTSELTTTTPTTSSTSLSPDDDEEDDHDILMDDDDEEEPDAEKRLARSRERNREHARRTRLRKKAQLEALQAKVKGLEAEGKTLRQALEECNIASILVGLSGGSNEVDESGATDDATDANMISPPPDESRIALLVAGKRKRFISDDMMDKQTQPLKLHIDGQTTLIGGGKTHINWKTGVYSDENGIHRQLTSEQLETLRRERNRMHAKMTRDRKKCFIKTIESTIHDLERENKRLRDLLSTKTITPQPSPMLTAEAATHVIVEEAPLLCSLSSSVASSPCPSPPLLTDVVEAATQPVTAKVTHGFSLVG